MNIGADNGDMSARIRELKTHSYKHTYQHLLISIRIKTAFKTGNYGMDNIF